MELMQAVEHYAAAMKLAERHGNKHGDMDAANNAWAECKKYSDEIDRLREGLRLITCEPINAEYMAQKILDGLPAYHDTMIVPDKTPALSIDGLGGMTPAAWMYKNANTDHWYLRWEEAKDRRSVPLYTPEQIAEIVASEHRNQKLLEDNCRILRREISELEASPMSEEALDILRSENDRLKQQLRKEGDRVAHLRNVLTVLSKVARRYLPDYDEHPALQLADEALETPNAR